MTSTLSDAMQIDRDMIKFKNKYCGCDGKAKIQISKSEKNSNELYFFVHKIHLVNISNFGSRQERNIILTSQHEMQAVAKASITLLTFQRMNK